MTTPYEDIIHLPHPVSSRRRHMTISERAAQFAPFAALSGFSSSIEETGRQTEVQWNPEAFNREALDRKLQLLMEMEPLHPQVTLTHFIPDERKPGGIYSQTGGTLKRIDPYDSILILTNGMTVPLQYITGIAFI